MLGLVAMACGAESVTCIEGGRMAYRMSCMVLSSNAHFPGCGKIKARAWGLPVTVVGGMQHVVC